jgi:F0F1-type ATP synthase assembly protein I
MRYVKQFVLFCWDFVVGDDWRMAAGVIVGVGLCYLLAHHGMNAWWMLPALIVVGLALSVAMVARGARQIAATSRKGKSPQPSVESS